MKWTACIYCDEKPVCLGVEFAAWLLLQRVSGPAKQPDVYEGNHWTLAGLQELTDGEIRIMMKKSFFNYLKMWPFLIMIIDFSALFLS